MFDLKGIAVGAAVGAGAAYAVKVDPMKGAIIGAVAAVAGPLVSGLINKAMYPAAVTAPK